MNSLGIQVIRFSNEEVNKDITKVKQKLVAILGT